MSWSESRKNKKKFGFWRKIIQKDRLLAGEIVNVPGHIAQKRIGKLPGNPRLFVNIAMGYGEIDKKVDVFMKNYLLNAQIML